MLRKTLTTALLFAALPLVALAQSSAPPASPSPSNQAAKSEAREKMRAACADDVQKFCANIERAKGAMRSCLEANDNNLSATCKAARAERSAARAKDKI